MLPIRKLLDRIRWDPDYGAALFEIGYLDRVAGGIVRVRFDRLDRDGFAFLLETPDGRMVRIPLHRVREVCRNGELIWCRPEAKVERSESGG